MSTRNTILKQLKTDLAKIKIANGYYITVEEVKRGLNLWEDMVNKPGVAFTSGEDKPADGDFGGDGVRTLEIFIYGYVNNNNNDYADLHNMIRSIEKFSFSTDWTYSSLTQLGRIKPYEAGSHYPAPMCEVQIIVFYEYDTASI